MSVSRRLVAVAVATTVASTVAAVAVTAGWPATGEATTTTVAEWWLDEPSGATVARDSSGNGHDGTVGTAVVRGVAGHAGTAFRFTPPGSEVSDPQRLVQVPDGAGLDPGDRNLRVSLWVRTSYAGDYNVLQKGQATTAGGFWKVQLDDGHPSCVFLGVTADGSRVSAGLRWGARVDDGAWHHVVCEKLSSYVRLAVDGASPVVAYRAVGHIANSWPLVMGGKSSCAPSKGVDCDYYRGDLDTVVLSTS
jgi:hypothetical protein